MVCVLKVVCKVCGDEVCSLVYSVYAFAHAVIAVAVFIAFYSYTLVVICRLNLCENHLAVCLYFVEKLGKI
jgi:hypothetical protein